MLLLCFLYTKPIILYFSDFCISNDDLFHSILQLFKISRPVFLYSKRFTNEFILQIYFILISFISIIIFLTFFDLYFLKSFFFFFDILFIKSRFYQITDPIFSSEKKWQNLFPETQPTVYQFKSKVDVWVTTTYNIFSHQLDQKH